MAQSIEATSAVIAISNSTRKDILRFFDIEPKKVTTVYLDASGSFRQSSKPHRLLPYKL